MLDSPGKRQATHWEYVPHSEDFYKNFGHILQLSEKLNIFVLPASKNKYGLVVLCFCLHWRFSSETIIQSGLR